MNELNLKQKAQNKAIYKNNVTEKFEEIATQIDLAAEASEFEIVVSVKGDSRSNFIIALELKLRNEGFKVDFSNVLVINNEAFTAVEIRWS